MTRLVALILLLLPTVAGAVPTITCHCFTDRSFDPARPAIADPYFLAATQNSFFSTVFGVDKKSIVIKKQQGESADDLWIAWWLGSRTGKNPEQLLQERKHKAGWRQVAASLTLPAGRSSSAFRSGASDGQLAKAVVNELLLGYRFYGEKDLEAMYSAGAGSKELILAALLSSRLRQPALQLYKAVKSGRESWGSLLQRTGIKSATEIQTELDRMIGGVK